MNLGKRRAVEGIDLLEESDSEPPKGERQQRLIDEGSLAQAREDWWARPEPARSSATSQSMRGSPGSRTSRHPREPGLGEGLIHGPRGIPYAISFK